MTIEEPAFKIKTGNLSVLKLHLLTTDIAQLKKQLALRLAQTPDFFASTPVVLELSSIAELDTVPNFSELTAFMLEQGMCAAGVMGGSELQKMAAAQAGLGSFVSSTAASRKEPDAAAKLPEQSELPGFAERVAEPVADQAVREAVLSRPTMVIDKPVRTGQRIYAEGANLVVLAIVNAGAELIADGDIHVYAPMRGRAIAGARGNEAARIFVQGMEAELLSIAGCFKVFEDAIPERAKPAQVRLEGSRLLIEPMPK